VSISAQNDKPDSIQEIKKITPKISLENITTDNSNYPSSCGNSVSNPEPNDSDSRNRECCSN